MSELLLIFVLGLKHGLDADHLALIDNLSRLLRTRAPLTAKFTGLLFSLGHSLAMLGMSLVFLSLGKNLNQHMPSWLDGTGTLLSVGALLLLALINLRTLFRPASPGLKPILASLASSLPGPFAAVAVLLIGALFAASFDTVAQTALFASLSHSSASPLAQALLLSGCFGLGMVLSDTINGLMMNQMLTRLADRQALRQDCASDAAFVKDRAGRFMTGSLALLSIAVASLALLKLSFQAIAKSLEGFDLAFGLGVIVWVLLSYAYAAKLAAAPNSRSPRDPASPHLPQKL